MAFAVADSYAPMWDGPCQLRTLFHGAMCDDNGTSPFCFLMLGRLGQMEKAAVSMHSTKQTRRAAGEVEKTTKTHQKKKRCPIFRPERGSTSIKEAQELLYFRSALAGVFRLWCIPLERYVAPRSV